jgi:surface protein
MLDQHQLQLLSENLKQLKIENIKHCIHKISFQFKLPYEIENIIFEYWLDPDSIETNRSLQIKVAQRYKLPSIENLDVSCVTSMFSLFKTVAYFDINLNKWDTTNVVDMGRMFASCSTIACQINLNTSNVTNMSFMFYDCTNFNQPVNFDTSKVTNMNSMFYNCSIFNQPVNFDTSNVTNMNSMFYKCYLFNQPVHFDTSNVNDMGYMFYRCKCLNQHIHFNNSKHTNMTYMFHHCKQMKQSAIF